MDAGRKHPLHPKDASWRRRLFLCLALIAALSWPLAASAQEDAEPTTPPEATAVPAALNPFSGGEGVISGQVINGTTGAAPPEGLEVRLRAFDMVNAAFVDAITTTTTSDGSFRFKGIDPAAPVQMEPLVVYQGIPYYGDMESAIVLSPEQPEVNVNITVHETTQDDSAIRIERLHVVFDFVLGQAQVVEIYILSNDGDRPYAGTAEGGTLRLTVPEAALTFQPGGDPDRYIALADGIADTIPIPPGESTAESVLIYELAYGDGLELSRPLPYDTMQAIVLVPDVGIEVSGDGLEPGGPYQMQDRTMQVYLANDLPAGDHLTLRLSGQPQARSAPAGPVSQGASEADETQSTIIGAMILTGSLALAYLYWQGHLRLRTQDRQSALLQAIADLDDDYKAGALKEKPYRSRRARLKQELIELMKVEE